MHELLRQGYPRRGFSSGGADSAADTTDRWRRQRFSSGVNAETSAGWTRSASRQSPHNCLWRVLPVAPTAAFWGSPHVPARTARAAKGREQLFHAGSAIVRFLCRFFCRLASHRWPWTVGSD